MNSILTLDKIPQAGLDLLVGQYIIGNDIDAPMGVLIRSSPLLEADLPDSVLAISRAGSGVNHIPCQTLADSGVVVMNTPGANANAVAEVAIAAMLIFSRRVNEATDWVASFTLDADIRSLAEKNKTRFKGMELTERKLGLFGLGATGRVLAKTAVAFGMEIWGYDPFLSPESRADLPEDIHIVDSLDILFSVCDFISLHVPSTSETHGIIDSEAIAKMKSGAFLINLARADLVNNIAVVNGVKSGHVAGYFTDFPSREFMGINQIIATPHLGGRSVQASDKCAIMAARQLKDYLETGSIANSIMFPSVRLSPDFLSRVCILHRALTQDEVLAAAKKDGLHPHHIISNQKGKYSCTVLDIETKISSDNVAHILRIPEVLRVRIL